MNERYNNPEQNIPSWEEILLAVIQRKVMPEDDPNRPPVDEISACRRYFRLANGDALTLIGGRDEPRSGFSWNLDVASPSGSHKALDVTLELYMGELRLIPANSEIPLDTTVVEHLVGQLASSTPLGEAAYFANLRPEPTQREA